MDDKQPNMSQTIREDSFDITVRGYNRQQVLEYMSRSSQLLASLEQNLAVARADVQRARAEAERAQAEADRLRAAQVEAKPVHEEVSGRLSQILRLAAEEADQERAKADEEIGELRAESQAESERMIAEARAQAERELSEARDTAERELTEARDTAEAELRAAHEEAERVRQDSEQQATDLLDDAARRAGAVNEVSDQRLDTLTATHGEAVLRLGQIRDVLADLLERDAAAGSLADVVEAVIAPSQRVRPDHQAADVEPADLDLEEDIEDVEQVEDDEDDEQGDDLEETSIVPAVPETAVHEPIEAEVVDGGPVETGRPAGSTGPNNTVEMEPVGDREIDLRDQVRTDPMERGVPTGR
ncbi:MAG TPA: ATP synthase F0 subunit B [Kineosporiaceae bacterium]|nr:ATP synthase F0 subunit B [Kineosporiaceae bacterium]